MSAQSVEEKPKEKKPRFFWRGFNCQFELSGERAVAFKGLLKHLLGFTGQSTYSYGAWREALNLGFEMDGLVVRALDSSRTKLADVWISKRDFEEFWVSQYGRLRLVEFPAFLGLPSSELWYALEGVDEDSSVRFNVSGVYKCRSTFETKFFRVPEACPKCGSPTHPALNVLPPEKRGKDGRSFKCPRCGWRGKVREKHKKVKVWLSSIASDKCEFNIEVKRKGNVEKFSLPVFEPEETNIPLPKVTFNATAKLVLKDFYEVIDRIAKKCDVVNIEASRDGLVLSGKGDFVKAEFPIKRGSDMLLDVKANGKVKSAYTVKELKACLPKLGDIVTISFSENMPIKTEIQTPLTDSTVTFWLAPIATS